MKKTGGNGMDRHTTARPGSAPVMRFLTLLFLTGILLFTLGVSEAHAYGIAVGNGTVNVYRSPDKASPVLSTIKAGDCYLVISTEGDWCKVFVLDNNIGYVPRSTVSVRWHDGRGIGIIADPTDYATIFSGPSGKYRALTKIREGVEYIIIGKDTWVRVVTREKLEGYIQAGQVIDIWP
jgi:uncharacterized protein YgiM (DUF1202 family)